MKKIILKIVNGIFIGITLGLILSLLFNYLNGNNNYYPSSIFFISHFNKKIDALSFSIFIWALMGIIGSTSTLIFKINNWSLLKQSTYHFLCLYISMTILAIIAGWFPVKFDFLFTYTIILLLIYFLIYFIKRMQFKRDVKLINKRIKQDK